MWKGLGQARMHRDMKREEHDGKTGQTEELLEENTAALNSSLLFTLTIYRFQFTVLKKQASRVKDLYL